MKNKGKHNFVERSETKKKEKKNDRKHFSRSDAKKNDRKLFFPSQTINECFINKKNMDVDREKLLFDLFDINQTTVQELFPGLNNIDFNDEVGNYINELYLIDKLTNRINQLYSHLFFPRMQNK